MNDLISRKALIAEYDRVHIGEAGNARKLIENAPAVDEPHWATEQAYKNGYEQGKKDATDNNVGSKWISVKDRLPENIGTYLVCTDKGGIILTHWYGNKFGGGYASKHITHWMPKPEPPKGE